jgi:hypothetical protein
MFRKLIPFLSLLLFTGVAFAAGGPPFARDSYAPSAMASNSGGRPSHHQKRHHRHRRHPHGTSSRLY